MSTLIGYWRDTLAKGATGHKGIPRAILHCRMNLKKIPEAVAAACLKNEAQLRCDDV